MNITGGIYNRQKVIAPDKSITRPTLSKIRMSVFNVLNSLIDFDGKSFLDMYSGSGIMGLEALSRGFCSITAIEKNKNAYNIIKSNFSKYEKKHNIKLIFGDSLKIVPKFNDKFDVIYIDPPYFSGIYEDSITAVQNISSGLVILEHVTDFDIPKDFEIIKRKKYGEKFITFLKKI